MYQRPAQKQGKHRTFEASFHTQLHHEHLCRTYGVLLFREQAGGTACTCGKIKPTHALLNKTYPELAYDPSVRSDMEQIYNRLVCENESYYQHTDEGSDDMPSHAKCSLTGVSLTIPVTGGKLNLGTWQGIYLCEFRDYGGPRRIVATIMG